MVLIDAICVESEDIKKTSAELAIDIIDSYRGSGAALLVSWMVYCELKSGSPDVFDYAESRGIKIIAVPC